ncbi:integrase, catalytic region, zinc finger, CCHC-type containing protein [Tanacetum coccineum]
MSTQQDIYVAGSKTRPLMLNKENYVPWSSRLLRYAKSRPNGMLIYNSNMNVPYVRRMIPEPGDSDREVPVNETFHEQTNEELTEKELKQVEANDQAIQTILLGLPEEIYAAVDSCETTQEIRLRDLHIENYTQLYDFLKYNQKEVVDLRAKRLAKTHDPLALMANSNNPFNYSVFQQGQPSPVTYMQQPPPNNNYNLQPSFNQNYMQQPMINPDDISDPTTAMNMNAVQNLGVQNVRNQNGLIVVSRVANQNPNGNGNVVATRAKGNANGNNGNQIRCYNYRGLGHLARNCIVRPRRRDAAYLHTQLLIAQKEEAGIQVQAEEFDFMADARDLDEIEEVNTNCILIANLQQSSTSGTQTDNAPVYDSDGSAENDSNVILAVSSMEQGGGTVEQCHAIVEETLEISVFDKVFEQKDTNKGTSVNTQFCKQSILGKPPSSSGLKLYSVTLFPKSTGLPKIDETHALSKPVTSNSVPTPQESKVVKNDNVIVPGMFRINPFKPSREEKFVPNKPIKASVRTIPITVSQPHVVTKKDVNSNSNGLSSTGVENTANTKRPQPRSNTKINKVPSVSKSSCIKNKDVEVEEHHRNLLLSKNKRHMSSECNKVKLAIWNDKSEVICAMCKQCLITANHDVCMLNYVNGLNSRGKKQKANVSNIANQMKPNPKASKPKKVGSKQRLALPKPKKPRSCLRWSPTRRIFDLKGKIIASSESESQSDCSNDDNEYSGCSKHMTSNLKLLINFISKYLGTVCFGNDHVAAILGYGDLQWENIMITRVFFVEGLGHNLFSIGQFCDSDLENQVLKEYFDNVGISHQASYVRTPQQNGVVVRRNWTLVEAARTMLIFSRAPLFLWAEAIATAKLDISFLHVFEALCYPKNDREDIGKVGVKGLNLTYAPLTITTQQPIEHDLGLLFEAMHDDYIGSQPSAAPRTVSAAQTPQVL